MFNLLVAIISVDLVIVISWARVYFGGKIYTDGKMDAEAAAIRSERTQIISSIALYQGHGNSTPQGLIWDDFISGGCLKTSSDGWIESNGIFNKNLDMEDEYSIFLCVAMNEQDGFDFTSTDNDVYALPDDKLARAVPICNKPDLSRLVSYCMPLSSVP